MSPSRNRNKSKRKQSQSTTTSHASTEGNDETVLLSDETTTTTTTPGIMSQELPSGTDVTDVETNHHDAREQIARNPQVMRTESNDALDELEVESKSAEETTTHEIHDEGVVDNVKPGIALEKDEEETTGITDLKDEQEKSDDIVVESADVLQALEQLPSGEIPLSEVHLSSPIMDVATSAWNENASSDETSGRTLVQNALSTLPIERNMEFIPNKDDDDATDKEKVDVLATDEVIAEDIIETEEMVISAALGSDNGDQPEESQAPESGTIEQNALATSAADNEPVESEKPTETNENAFNSNVEEKNEDMIVTPPDESPVQEENVAVTDDQREKQEALIEEQIEFPANTASEIRVKSAQLDAPQPHADDDESEGHVVVIKDTSATAQQQEDVVKPHEMGVESLNVDTQVDNSPVKGNVEEETVDVSVTEGKGVGEHSVEADEAKANLAQEINNADIAIDSHEPVLITTDDNEKTLDELVSESQGVGKDSVEAEEAKTNQAKEDDADIAIDPHEPVLIAKDDKEKTLNELVTEGQEVGEDSEEAHDAKTNQAQEINNADFAINPHEPVLSATDDKEKTLDELVSEGQGVGKDSVEPEEAKTNKTHIAIDPEESRINTMDTVDTFNLKVTDGSVDNRGKDSERNEERGELSLGEAPIISPSFAERPSQALKASVQDPPTDDPRSSTDTAEASAGISTTRSKDPPASVKVGTEASETVGTKAHSLLPFVGDIVLAEQFDGDISTVLLETDVRDSKILDASESIVAEAWSDVEPWSDDVDIGPGYIKPASTTPKPMLTSIFVKRSTKGHPGLSEVPSDEVLVESMSMDTLSVSIADPLPKKDPVEVIQHLPKSSIAPLDANITADDKEPPKNDVLSSDDGTAPSISGDAEKTIVSQRTAGDPPDAPEDDMIVVSAPNLNKEAPILDEEKLIIEDSNQPISAKEVIPDTNRLEAVDSEDAPDDEVMAIKNEEASGNPLISSALSPSSQKKQNEQALETINDNKVLSSREAYNDKAIISPDKSFENRRKPDPSGTILTSNYPTRPPTPPPVSPQSQTTLDNQAQDSAASSCGACQIM